MCRIKTHWTWTRHEFQDINETTNNRESFPCQICIYKYENIYYTYIYIYEKIHIHDLYAYIYRSKKSIHRNQRFRKRLCPLSAIHGSDWDLSKCSCKDLLFPAFRPTIATFATHFLWRICYRTWTTVTTCLPACSIVKSPNMSVSSMYGLNKYKRHQLIHLQ